MRQACFEFLFSFHLDIVPTLSYNQPMPISAGFWHLIHLYLVPGSPRSTPFLPASPSTTVPALFTCGWTLDQGRGKAVQPFDEFREQSTEVRKSARAVNKPVRSLRSAAAGEWRFIPVSHCARMVAPGRNYPVGFNGRDAPRRSTLTIRSGSSCRAAGFGGQPLDGHQMPHPLTLFAHPIARTRFFLYLLWRRCMLMIHTRLPEPRKFALWRPAGVASLPPDCTGGHLTITLRLL